MTDQPEKALLPCPFCGQPLAYTSGKLNISGRCDTKDCWLHERKIAIPIDDPRQVSAFNTRAPSGVEGEAVAWKYQRGDGYFEFQVERDHKRMPPWDDRWTETPLYATPPAPPAQSDEVGRLREALTWYRDQMCEGHCEGFTPRICKALLAKNPTGGDCTGCRATLALTPAVEDGGASQ